MEQKFLIPISIVIAGLLISGTIFYFKKPERASRILSPKEAAQKAIDYINQNLLKEGMKASLLKVIEENGVYKFNLKVGEREFESYVTKNGKLLFIEGINLEEKPSIKQKSEITPQKILKRERPDVKLFVMSHCPFGLQAQKMYLPVYDLLKDKVDMGIYFVDYIMHGKKEIDDNLRQYCIQKEENEKFISYLSCFLKDGDFEKCLLKANINREMLSNCISETDSKYNITAQYKDKNTWLNGRFPPFDVHKELNEKYGVRGSPTIVINDSVVNITPRSPEKFKQVICQAFIEEPKECSQRLSNEVFSPGFGLEIIPSK